MNRNPATPGGPFLLHCAQCNGEWESRLRLPMPVDRAVLVMKGEVAAGCPHCGAHGPAVVVCGSAVPT